MDNPVILHTEAKPLADCCTGATLSLASDSAGSLSLTFAGEGPEWVEYMRPVCLYHHGELLFAGRITHFSRTNSAGHVETAVQVEDFRYILAGDTFGAQKAAAKEGLSNSGGTSMAIGQNNGQWKRALGAAASSGARSWHALAAHCSVPAPGWAPESDSISLDVSRSRLSFSGPDYSGKGSTISSWTVLRDMQTANPDCLYRPRYATATLEVISVSVADRATWSTATRAIEGLETIEPQYDRLLDGVVVFVTYSDAKGREHLITRSNPASIPDTALRVSSFTSSADSATHAQLQAANLAKQAAAYMEAVNEMPWGGTITTRILPGDSSLIATRLSITGPGCRPEWGTMAAPVTAEEWDFLAGRRTLTLGKDWADPTLSQLQWDPARELDEVGGDGEDPDSPGGSPSRPLPEPEEGWLSVYLEEEGEPKPSEGGALQTRTISLHAADKDGRDLSTSCSYTLYIEGLADARPELEHMWMLDPPDASLELTLPTGQTFTAVLTAVGPANQTTNPEEDYTHDLCWGDPIGDCDTTPPEQEEPIDPYLLSIRGTFSEVTTANYLSVYDTQTEPPAPVEQEGWQVEYFVDDKFVGQFTREYRMPLDLSNQNCTPYGITPQTHPTGTRSLLTVRATLPSGQVLELKRPFTWGECDCIPPYSCDARPLIITLSEPELTGSCDTIIVTAQASQDGEPVPPELLLWTWSVSGAQQPTYEDSDTVPPNVLEARFDRNAVGRQIHYSVTAQDKQARYPDGKAEGYYTITGNSTPPQPVCDTELRFRKIQSWADLVQRTLMLLWRCDLVNFPEDSAPWRYDLDLQLPSTPHTHSDLHVLPGGGTFDPTPFTPDPQPGCGKVSRYD